MKTTVTLLSAVALLAAGCTGATAEDTPPAPLGESHVLGVAREMEILDPVTDEVLVDIARSSCRVIESSQDFDTGMARVDSQIFDRTDDLYLGLALFVVAGSGIPAFCPEYLEDLETWAD